MFRPSTMEACEAIMRETPGATRYADGRDTPEMRRSDLFQVHLALAYVAASRTQARGDLPGNAPETPVPAGKDGREIGSARPGDDRDTAEAAVLGEFGALRPPA